MKKIDLGLSTVARYKTYHQVLICAKQGVELEVELVSVKVFSKKTDEIEVHITFS